MIRDRYDPMQLFDLVPQLGLTFEPELAELDRLLEDDELFRRVKADLSRRRPRSLTRGRRGTPVEVVLRMLVVRRLYDWSYEGTERFVSDSLVLRQFCRLYLEPAPDDTTLLRWAGLIGPETVERLNERAVELARSLKVTRGRKLRSDSTVVETNIAYPRDSSLLADGVRVLGRSLRRAKAALGRAGLAAAMAGREFRDRSRGAKRLAHRIAETARRRGEEAAVERREAYRRLLGAAGATLRQAGRVRERLAAGDAASARLLGDIDRFVPLVRRVVEQAERRVLRGEAVPAAEKLVSLFEPHSYVIRRGKPHKAAEFGRKVWLDEVDGGIVSRYAVLAGNPPDSGQVAACLDAHRRLFGHPPDLFAGDRGLHTPENEDIARRAGVRRVALPQPGAKTPERRRHERQRWYRRALRFRAGAEGRISVLKRRGYLGPCRDKGEAGFGRWVGWGILTHNLATIARARVARA
jgi:transposase, IS5 family